MGMMLNFRRYPRSVLARLVRISWLGQPLSKLLLRCGMERLCRRVSRISRFVPENVFFRVHDSHLASKEGSLSSQNGHDQIARSIWLNGLDAYEAPLPAIFVRLVRALQGGGGGKSLTSAQTRAFTLS